MRNFDYGIIYGLIYHDTIWVRLGYFKYGLHLTRSHMLFSERNGLADYHLPLLFGWRIGILKAE